MRVTSRVWLARAGILTWLGCSLAATEAALPATAEAAEDVGVSKSAPKVPADGPPFELTATSPHRITMSLDVEPARDILTVLAGGADGPAALKRLRASRAVGLSVARDGGSPEQFFGRVVATAAGSPDALFSTFLRARPLLEPLLENMATEAVRDAEVEGRRIGLLLPGAAIAAKLVVVPFLGLSGFADVAVIPDGADPGTIYLLADIPRLYGDVRSGPPPREMVLKILRTASSEAWKTLFFAHVMKPPAWAPEGAPDFEALLSRTVSEGAATLFLFPDEFFPIGILLEEPIARSFERWNNTVELLVDPKKKDLEKRDALADSTRGDFWGRHAAIVGAQMTDTLLRLVGREAYLNALAAGPRSVATLYATASKGKKLPQFGRAAKRALEARAPS